MLFLTILFLAFTLVSLIKGKLWYQMSIDLMEEEIKKQTDTNYKPNKDLAGKVIFCGLFSIAYLITYIVYLTNAINIDPLKYPSLFMLLWYLVSFIIGYKKGSVKKDFTNPEILNKQRKKIYKKRTLFGTFSSLVTLVYFIYMTYIIVF